MKTLVTYFSAESGRTAGVAKELADAIGADLFEIRPVKPYSASDLNYMNPIARCNREFMLKKKVALFATSGGSGIGKTVKKLEPYVKGAEILDARMMNGAGAKEMKTWVE